MRSSCNRAQPGSSGLRPLGEERGKTGLPKVILYADPNVRLHLSWRGGWSTPRRTGGPVRMMGTMATSMTMSGGPPDFVETCGRTTLTCD